MHYPGFSCPLCRTFADLDADVEQDEVSSDLEEIEGAEEEEDDTRALPALVDSVNGLAQSTDSPAPAGHSRASRRSSTASRRAALMEDIPDAGDFQMDIRRASIHVSGPRGTASPIAITGRTSRPPSLRSISRPASTFNLDMTATGRSIPHRSSLEHMQHQRDRTVNDAFALNGLSPQLPSDFATSIDHVDADLLPGAFVAQEDLASDAQDELAGAPAGSSGAEASRRELSDAIEVDDKGR